LVRKERDKEGNELFGQRTETLGPKRGEKNKWVG